MNAERPRFPVFGHGGDHVGAKRARRAFRFFVMATVLFTGLLCFAERYLKYNRAETHYMIALTFEPESARPWLRHAVKEDERTHEVPTPKYVQALAAREEDELILPTYAKAFELDPANADIAIRYGCRLAQAGRIKDAAEKFDAAATNDPQNALPIYLKAAVLARTGEKNRWVSESLTLVAQANNSGNRVVFPRPLWFSELPQRGVRYAALCREIVNEGVAPVFIFADAVAAAAQADLKTGGVQHWDSWLETLQKMGKRFVESAEDSQKRAGDARPGIALQAIAGIYVQRTALGQRIKIADLQGADAAELRAEDKRLQDALAVLTDFENDRDEKIADDRSRYMLAGRLFLDTLLVLLAAYAIFYAAWRLWGRRILVESTRPRTARTEDEAQADTGKWDDLAEDPEWTIRHPIWAKCAFAGAGLLWLVLLLFLATVQRHQLGDGSGPVAGLWMAWWVCTTVLLVGGMFYPTLVLPSTQRALDDMPEGEEETGLRGLVKSMRRRAAICLQRRYFGILVGTFLTTFAIWVLIYRIATSLYPWQIQLLTSGLSEEEGRAVYQAFSILM